MTEVLEAAVAELRQGRLATWLAGHGLREGDRVALVPAEPAMTARELCLVGAAVRTGVVPVVVNPGLVEAEQAEILADADPALVLRGDAVAQLEDVSHDAAVAAADLAPAPRCRPMLYTSGTTGRPKGVWSGLLTDAEAASMRDEEAELWGFDAADIHLVCGGLHHSAPTRFALGTLLAGGTVVLPGRFDGARAARALDDFAVSTTFMAPIHLSRTLQHAPRASSLRLVAHAGAPCPEPLKRAAIAALPEGSVWEFYGSTEGQFTACSPDEWLARPGTVGRARPGRRLATDDGVVWCHTPSWARFEYWRDEQKTAAAWRGDAFTVGDLGRLDDEGYLYLDGRRDDLIISGGINVYPAEVERVLGTIDGVDEVAVFGRPDDRWGQRVCAAVVGTVDEGALRAAAAERLAHYKRPKEVHVVAEIPVSTNGKVRRSTLAVELGLEDGSP